MSPAVGSCLASEGLRRLKFVSRMGLCIGPRLICRLRFGFYSSRGQGGPSPGDSTPALPSERCGCIMVNRVYRHQASGMTALRHRTNKRQRRQHCKPFPTCKFLRAWAEEVVFVRIHTPCPRDGFMKVHCPDGTEQSGSASVRTSHFLRQMPEAVDNFTPSSLSFCIPFRQAIL